MTERETRILERAQLVAVMCICACGGAFIWGMISVGLWAIGFPVSPKWFLTIMGGLAGFAFPFVKLSVYRE